MTSALLWLALAAAPCAAQAPSTAPARGAAEPVNPWSLAYGVDRRGDRYGRVEYRLRWSFDDLSPAPPGFDRAHAQRANFGELTMRGLLQSSRVELYGVMVRPFRDLPLTPREDAYVVATSTDAAAAAPPAPARRRRLDTWAACIRTSSSAHGGSRSVS